MRIGIKCDLKKGFGRWGDEKYKKLKEIGFDAVDFDLSDTETELYGEGGEEILLRQKALAKEAGIEIHQCHGPWRFPPKDYTLEDRKERMDKMKKSIRMASVLGCKNWVVHPLMPCGIEEIGTEDATKTWDINIEFMKELTRTAREYDVIICYENMPMHKFSLGKPEDILRVVDEINDDHFKVCLDTGHVNVYENVLEVAEEVRRIGNKIQIMHIHDNKCKFDLHMSPYYGWINWEEFAASLKDINYKGVFSLEVVPPEGLPDHIFYHETEALYKIAKHISDMAE